MYVVATPIGNLRDLSARALDVLRSVSAILAEDTRHSAKLLRSWDIATPLVSHHQHSGARAVDRALRQLNAGKSLALISDAGTPLLHDPGAPLVRAAVQAGIRVVPIPGPSALLAALVGSGFPADTFHFAGFLPSRQGQRLHLLQQLSPLSCALVFYEAPHRLAKTLADLQAVDPDRPAVIARELTKLHETFYRGRPDELLTQLREDPNMARGEMVLIWAPREPGDLSHAPARIETDELLRALVREVSPSAAARIAAKIIRGSARGELYERALKLGAQVKSEGPNPAD